ncbi:MAG: hypothetical protein KJ787_09990 [Gammaproteobacteria bacterium]|nr:hypothetical protein [Gammaproteobacteria bacterium]MBU1646651.1 hypothetical protein [Gammaproteobacteria bacterium]MBU1972908.1 hypothetical protein [Gammaproteobacteria bacterium]
MKILQAGWLAVMAIAPIAAAQHPHMPPGGLPYTPNLPVNPGMPAFSYQDLPPLQPDIGAAAKSMPAGEFASPLLAHSSAPMPPLFPKGAPIPPDRTTAPPASIALKVVEDRIRLTEQTAPPKKLSGVEVAIAKGGYLVTRKYEDYSATLSDGRPAYLWEMTTFVSEDEVRVKTPVDSRPPEKPATQPLTPPAARPAVADKDTRPPIPTPPKPPQPLQDKPPTKPSPGDAKTLLGLDEIKFKQPVTVEPVPIKPAEFRDINDPKALEQRLREISASFDGTVIHDRFSDESVAMMEEVMAAAGKAGLDTGLAVGSFVPVAGTVIMAGQTFAQQYQKTRDTLLKAGIDPDIAHQKALLQATAVTGVAIGVDLATGSVAGKLKTFIRNPLVESALRDKKWRDESARHLGQAVDIGVDLALTAGKSILQEAAAGGQSGSQPLAAFGDDRNGMVFLVQ